MEAVCDAGPLIHLYEIGGLALLRIFDRLHIPEVVWMETVGQGRVPEGAITALRSVERHEVARRAVEAFAEQHGLGPLHKGERACLYLCRSRPPISIVLTDDLAVREAVHKLELTPVGSASD